MAPIPRYLLACVLAATLGGAAACSDAVAPPPAPAPAASSGAPGFFGGTDLAWIEINIAMDEQLAPLLALAPRHSRNARVKALNAEVKAFSSAELSTLRQLHDEAKLPAENPHEGMVMPGMVTPSEVAQAATLDGTDFDALTLKTVRDYLTQGVNLAQSEAKNGVEPRTRALAASGQATRTEILTSLSA